MDIKKPLLIRKKDTNKATTSSGEFLEYVSWRESNDLGFGIGVHNKRFPANGYLINKKVDEIIMLKKGAGTIVAKYKDKDELFVLEKDAVVLIPKTTPFYFEPNPSMEILSATGPAWNPKQQSGLDYKRKDAGRMIL